MTETDEKVTHYSRHAVNTTYTDVGSADIAGANICHPCRLGIRIPAAELTWQGLFLQSYCISSIHGGQMYSRALINQQPIPSEDNTLSSCLKYFIIMLKFICKLLLLKGMLKIMKKNPS